VVSLLVDAAAVEGLAEEATTMLREIEHERTEQGIRTAGEDMIRRWLEGVLFPHRECT
jgi:hypothetical protein